MKIKYKGGGKMNPPDKIYKSRINAARKLLKKQGVNNPNLTDAEVEKAAKVKKLWSEAGSMAKQALKTGDTESYGFENNFSKGGKVNGKGMTTAERKNQYMDSVKEKQEKEKAETRKKDSSKLATSYGSTRIISPSPEETSKFVSGALDNIEAKREEKKYKPAREAASKRFDEATKYDELLGRSTNPDKYYKGGKMPKAGYGMRIKKKK